jgi:hypothetical protein
MLKVSHKRSKRFAQLAITIQKSSKMLETLRSDGESLDACLSVHLSLLT